MNQVRGTTITTTAPNSEELEQLALHAGITLINHDEGPKGWYYPTHNLISLRKNLTWIERRCTLAHELAHAILAHFVPAPPWLEARQEREADEWAANQLITTDEYATAEQLCDAHPGAIARELGVTIHLVNVWQSLYRRVNAY